MTKIFDTPLYPYSRSADQDAASPVRHPVVIVGAGPVGLALAIDLAQQHVPVVVLDDNDKVSSGSRAICFAKRTLEIFDRLGCGDELVDKGVQWSVGKVYFDERQVFEFNLLPEDGHKRPAFINLQQYYLEQRLVERLRELEADGAAMELRGKSRVAPSTKRSMVYSSASRRRKALIGWWPTGSSPATAPARRCANRLGSTSSAASSRTIS